MKTIFIERDLTEYIGASHASVHKGILVFDSEGFVGTVGLFNGRYFIIYTTGIADMKKYNSLADLMLANKDLTFKQL